MEGEKKTSEEKYMVPAVEQASRVLFCLAGNSSSQMSLLEICSQVGIHKSKAYSILQTLQKFGLVQRFSDRKGYALGPGLITLSRKVLDDFNAPRLAEPILEELATKFGGTATLGLIADRIVFVVAKNEGGVDIGVTIRTGHRFPLTYGSHGKAIAASLPEKELEHLLKETKLYFHGSSEKLDRNRLAGELAQCRADGYALDLGEMKPGLNSVAAAVFGPGETPIGYIALIGLFPSETARESGPLVSTAAKTLSRQLGARID
jgi:DNA-binding IclR family transcriptional regulator